MLELLHLLCHELAAGRPVAMATIVFQEGSAPRGTGSKLIAGPSGLLAGTTGGGLAEAQAIAACIDACRSGLPSVVSFDMDGTLAANSEMICGGHVRLLIEAFLPQASVQENKDSNSTTQAAPETARLALEAIQRCGCRIVRPFPPNGEDWTLLYDDGTQAGNLLPESVRQALLQADIQDAAVVHCGTIDYFCEDCRPPERMIIAGGGHVSLATAQIATLTDFAVHVLDDRPEFANAERFPSATVHVTPEYTDCFDSLRITPQDYLVIVTRGHLFDGIVAAQALRTPAGYIGMIGSKRKREQVYARLRNEGFNDADIARIHSPIGLSIGAETPAEIAVSILAECIAHRRHHLD